LLVFKVANVVNIKIQVRMYMRVNVNCDINNG